MTVEMAKGTALQPVAAPGKLYLARIVQILFYCYGSRVSFFGIRFHGMEDDLAAIPTIAKKLIFATTP